MRRDVIIVEDFYASPLAVRNHALGQSFYHPYQSAAAIEAGRLRSTWRTSRFCQSSECPFKSSERLIANLEQITGDKVDREHWNLGFPLLPDGRPDAACMTVERSCLWNCCFHFKPQNGQTIGRGVHNHVIDIWNRVGEDGWAGLIYLNPEAPLDAGLRLWRNRTPGKNYEWMTGAANWELIDTLGNVFNRLILCRGSLPHSGSDGWTDSIEAGRLYQTFFFRVMPQAQLAPMEINLDAFANRSA